MNKLDKLKCHKLLHQYLIQNEQILWDVFIPIDLILKKKKLDRYYFLKSNFRVFLINSTSMSIFEEVLLLSEFQNIPDAERLIEKKQKKSAQQEVSSVKYLQPKIWPDIILGVEQVDEQKLRMAFEQIDTTLIFEEEVKRNLLESNKEIAAQFKSLVLEKKLVEEDRFWQNCPQYDKAQIYLKEQTIQQQNIEDLSKKVIQSLPVYPKNYSELKEPAQLYQINFQDNLETNLDLESDRYSRVRPAKRTDNKELQTQQFENIEAQFQINQKLNQQYIQQNGMEIIDYDNQLPKTRILKQDFISQLVMNDGVKFEVQPSSSKMEIDIIKKKSKQKQTSAAWEHDKIQILKQMNHYDKQKSDLKESIINDYALACNISAKQKQRLEQKDGEYFKQIRQFSSDVRRQLQYLYESKNRKDDPSKYQDILAQLALFIKQIRRKIDEQQSDKYKVQILEDLQKMIERGVGE